MAVTASISLKENSYSVANNSSSVTCKVTVHWTYSSNDRNGTTKTLTFNGSKFTTTANINSSVTSSGSMTLFNKTLTVAHNSDGTKTVRASVRIPTSTSSGTVTASKSLTLTAIPRYPTVNQSLASASETALSVRWSSNDVIDYVWYSVNSGSWVAVGNPSASSGSFLISGLNPATSYTVKTRLRRKSSQLSADSTTATYTTYNYPYCTSAPNFTIGDKLTLGFYNPLGRTFQFYIIANGQSIANNPWTISGTSYSGINADSTQDQLYATIPNSKSATYQVKCVYGSSQITKTGGTYTASSSNASPSFSSGSYQDTNQTVITITGDNQKLLPTRSTIQFNMSGMTARLYASVSSAYVSLNNTTYPMTISGSSATVSNVPLNSSGQNASLTVVDSRGLTYSQTVTLDIVDYTAPSISATAERDSGFYSETDITPTVNYTSIGSNAVTINLKARKVGTTSYTVDQTIPDGETTQVVLDNESAWEILLTATDSLGGTGAYNITVARGLPLMYFDTEMLSIGVNQFPSHSESFEIAGDLYINASKLADFVIEESTSGIWTYRKWASGIAECWGRTAETTVNITHNYNGHYYGSGVVNLPSNLFTSVPSVTASRNSSGVGVTWLQVYGITASSFRYDIANIISVSVPVSLGVEAKGRWK